MKEKIVKTMQKHFVELFEAKEIADSTIKEQVRDRLVHAIINLCLSFQKASSTEFRTLLTYVTQVAMEVGHAIDFNQHGLLLRRAFMSKTVKRLAKEIRHELTNMMNDPSVAGITITCDHWKCALTKRDYLGITAHFVIRRNGSLQLVNLVLALIPAASHHASVLAEDFRKVANEYNISDKVRFIVTDGASTNSLAFNKNDSYRQLLDKFVDYDDAYIEEEEVYEAESSERVTIGDLEKEHPLLGHFIGRQWIWCVAHLLQLACSHAFKSLPASDLLFSSVENCKYIVNSVHRSHAAALLQKSLKTDIAVRWDSKSTMVDSVIDSSNEQLLRDIANRSKNETLKKAIREVLSESSKAILRSFCEVMDAVTKHRKIVSSDQYPTLGAVICQRQLLLHQLKGMSESVERAVQPFVKNLIKEIEYYVQINDPFAIAAILNPKFDEDTLEGMLKIKGRDGVEVDWFEKGKKLIKDFLTHIDSSAAEDDAADAEDEMSIFKQGKSASSSQNDELMTFLREDKRVRDYAGALDWYEKNKSRYPGLYQLFLNFAGSATSVPSERLFSMTGVKVGKQNMNLKPDTLQALMLYYCNSDLVNNGSIRLPFSAYLTMGEGDLGAAVEEEAE